MYQFTIPQAFWDGECFDAYRWMGGHPSAGPRGEAGWQFTLFAPGAKAVSVCGSWPGGEDVPMEKNEAGFWRVYIPGPAEGDSYQYRITGGGRLGPAARRPLRLCQRAAARHGQQADRPCLFL